MAKRKILKDFLLTEISAVDRPAQPTARAVIVKRADEMTSFEHDFIVDNILKFRNDEFETPVGAVSSFEAFSKRLKMVGVEHLEKSQELVDELVTNFLEDVKKDLGDEAVGDFVLGLITGKFEKQEDNNMSDQALKELQDKLTKAEGDLEHFQKMANMDDAEKTFMKSMDESKKKEFMGMSPEERKKEMKKAADADESLEINGAKVTKSAVGEQTFMVLKAQKEMLEQQQEELRKSREAAETAKFEKRAAEEFGAVVGETTIKAKILKMAENADEEVKKGLLEIMTTAQTFAKMATDELGTDFVKGADYTSAQEQLDTLVKNYRAEHEGVSEEVAYDIVLEQNPDLYEKLS